MSFRAAWLSFWSLGGIEHDTGFMTRKLTREEMVQAVENITHPKDRGFSSEEITRQLLVFCMSCPDPVAAMDLMVEDKTPMTAQELVDKALAYPVRDISKLSESELALTHPFRHMRLEH